jgi:hypothetical protein
MDGHFRDAYPDTFSNSDPKSKRNGEPDRGCFRIWHRQFNTIGDTGRLTYPGAFTYAGIADP